MIQDWVSSFNYSETSESLRLNTLNQVYEVCKFCIKCDLSKTRTKVVFSSGNPAAKLMLIGEAPGKNEDEQGESFVGRAGHLLDKFLSVQNISREKDIYICSVVKCRPPENRVPTPDEMSACREYLAAQIQLVRPAIILLAGATAVKSMLNTNSSISKIRGQWFDGPFDSKIMPIFHPSYLLRYHSEEPDTPRWLTNQDFSEVKKLLDKLKK